MNYDVYCNEICPDLLTSFYLHRSHAVIGRPVLPWPCCHLRRNLGPVPHNGC